MSTLTEEKYVFVSVKRLTVQTTAGGRKVVNIVAFVSLILHFLSFMVFKANFISVHFIAVDISCLLMSKKSK